MAIPDKETTDKDVSIDEELEYLKDLIEDMGLTRDNTIGELLDALEQCDDDNGEGDTDV